MKAPTMTVKDYLRAFSHIAAPVANKIASAMTVTEYVRGQGQQPIVPQRGPGQTRHEARRPWQEWAQDNHYGHDTEHDRFEREAWMEHSFYDADFGVTYGESTWDGRWNNDEAWRR